MTQEFRAEKEIKLSGKALWGCHIFRCILKMEDVNRGQERWYSWKWGTQEEMPPSQWQWRTLSRSSLNFHDGDIGQLPYSHRQGLGFWKAGTMYFLLFFCKAGPHNDCYPILSPLFFFSHLLQQPFSFSFAPWINIFLHLHKQEKGFGKTAGISRRWQIFFPFAHLTEWYWLAHASFWMGQRHKPGADKQKHCL